MARLNWNSASNYADGQVCHSGMHTARMAVPSFNLVYVDVNLVCTDTIEHAHYKPALPAINLPAANAERVSDDAMHTDMISANTSHTCTRLIVINETVFELVSFAKLIRQSRSKSHMSSKELTPARYKTRFNLASSNTDCLRLSLDTM